MVARYAMWASFLLVVTTACTPTSSSDPGNSNASGSDDGSKKSDDSPNKSAPISGAYLADATMKCKVFEPPATDQYLYAGCRMVDKQGNLLPAAAFQGTSWVYLPPSASAVSGAGAAPAVDVFDLTSAKPGTYFYNSAYRVALPAAPSGGTGGATSGGTASGFTRSQTVQYLLASSPILLRPQLLSQVKSAASSLALRGAAKHNLSLVGAALTSAKPPSFGVLTELNPDAPTAAAGTTPRDLVLAPTSGNATPNTAFDVQPESSPLLPAAYQTYFDPTATGGTVTGGTVTGGTVTGGTGAGGTVGNGNYPTPTDDGGDDGQVFYTNSSPTTVTEPTVDSNGDFDTDLQTGDSAPTQDPDADDPSL